MAMQWNDGFLKSDTEIDMQSVTFVRKHFRELEALCILQQVHCDASERVLLVDRS